MFVWDRQSGAIVLVSRKDGGSAESANEESLPIAISSTGDFVLFESKASDLVEATFPASLFNVFRWRRSDGSIELVSHRHDASMDAALGESRGVAASDDGRWILFHSDAPDIVNRPVSNFSSRQVYRYDAFTGVSTLLTPSVAKPGGYGDLDSFGEAISADGQTILIQSFATDILEAAVDAPNTSDLFVWRATEPSLAMVSHADGKPTVAANKGSFAGTMDRGGSLVVFESEATDLDSSVQVPVNPGWNVYRWDATTGATRMVSHSTPEPDQPAGGNSRNPVVSGGGSHIAFDSRSARLAPADYSDDSPSNIFVTFNGVFADGFETGTAAQWSSTEPETAGVSTSPERSREAEAGPRLQ